MYPSAITHSFSPTVRLMLPPPSPVSQRLGPQHSSKSRASQGYHGAHFRPPQRLLSLRDNLPLRIHPPLFAILSEVQYLRQVKRMPPRVLRYLFPAAESVSDDQRR